MLSPVDGAVCELRRRGLSVLHVFLNLNSKLRGLYFESQFMVWDYKRGWYLIELMGHHCSTGDVSDILSRLKGVIVNVGVNHLLRIDWRHPASYVAC